MQLLKWWITILDTLSPADAAVWSILGAAIVVLLFFIVRWGVAFWALHAGGGDGAADPAAASAAPQRAGTEARASEDRMILDMPSFGFGLMVAAAIAYAWMLGRDGAIRLARRIARHGRSLDHVFFEDAETDTTITRPSPATADVREFQRESQR